MTPTDMEGRTRVLGAPEDWDAETHGTCGYLPIVDRDGFMISCWTPSPEDIERIVAGDPIYLVVRGENHPVVSLRVGT